MSWTVRVYLKSYDKSLEHLYTSVVIGNGEIYTVPSKELIKSQLDIVYDHAENHVTGELLTCGQEIIIIADTEIDIILKEKESNAFNSLAYYTGALTDSIHTVSLFNVDTGNIIGELYQLTEDPIDEYVLVRKVNSVTAPEYIYWNSDYNNEAVTGDINIFVKLCASDELEPYQVHSFSVNDNSYYVIPNNRIILGEQLPPTYDTDPSYGVVGYYTTQKIPINNPLTYAVRWTFQFCTGYPHVLILDKNERVIANINESYGEKYNGEYFQETTSFDAYADAYYVVLCTCGKKFNGNVELLEYNTPETDNSEDVDVPVYNWDNGNLICTIPKKTGEMLCVNTIIKYVNSYANGPDFPTYSYGYSNFRDRKVTKLTSIRVKLYHRGQRRNTYELLYPEPDYNFVYKNSSIVVGQPLPERTEENGILDVENFCTYKKIALTNPQTFTISFSVQYKAGYAHAILLDKDEKVVANIEPEKSETYDGKTYSIKYYVHKYVDAYYVVFSTCGTISTSYLYLDICGLEYYILYYYDNRYLSRYVLIKREDVLLRARAYPPEFPIKSNIRKLKWYRYDLDFNQVTGFSQHNNIEITQNGYSEYRMKYIDGVDNSVIEERWLVFGNSVEYPEPPKHEGYVFDRWINKTETNSVTDAYAKVTASYIYSMYKVTYLDRDGETIIKEEVVALNGSATPPEFIPSDEDYIFGKWVTSPEEADPNNVTMDITFTAVYRQVYFYVTFVDVEDNVLKVERVYMDKDATPPEAPPREGYVFKEWDTSYEMIRSDRTCKAIYESDKSAIYTVRFIDKDGTLLKKQLVYNHSSATPPNVTAPEGYVFTGWDNDFSDVMSNITVMALYKERDDTFKVKFLDNGTVLSETYVRYGKAAIAPEPLGKVGYEFKGWSRAFDYITDNIVVCPIYVRLWSGNKIECYSTNADTDEGKKFVYFNYKGSIEKVIDCSIYENLNGECTIWMKTVMDYKALLNFSTWLRYDNLFFQITDIRLTAENGSYKIEVRGEHISYYLDNDAFNIDQLELYATPQVCLAYLLNGTYLKCGTVEMDSMVVFTINKTGTSRRKALMQLAALCKAEIEYHGMEIWLVKQRGERIQSNLVEVGKVTNITAEINKTENKYSYSVEFAERPPQLRLGDYYNLIVSQMGLSAFKRICAFEYNPYNYRSFKLTLGDYSILYDADLYEYVQEIAEEQEKQKRRLSWSFPEKEEELEPEEPASEGVNVKVISCESLPNDIDPDTIYLIRGQVVMY